MTPIRWVQALSFVSLVLAAPRTEASGHCVRGARDVFAHRVTEPTPFDDRGYDVRHYDLAVDIQGNVITGTVTVTADALRDGLTDVTLDLYDAYSVSNVTSTSHGVSTVSAKARTVTITLASPVTVNDTFDVSLSYTGTPPDVGGPVTQSPVTFDTHGDAGAGTEAPVIFTLSVPNRSGTWWPCKEQLEDKATIDLAVTVADTLVVASNGVLESVSTPAPGRATYHWSHGYPIVPYLVSLAISNYTVLTDEAPILVAGVPDTVAIEYYVYPELVAEATVDFERVPESIAFLSDRLGPYPFRDEKYGIALIEWGGGMEHQTCVSVGRSFITGTQTYEWLYVHELSHQWWGDWLSIKDLREIWLNEGFATYAEAMWEEYRFGRDAYLAYMRSLDPFPPPTFSGYVSAIYDPAPLYGDAPYDKGAWVLHMLRHVVGDAAFFDILPTYMATYASGNAAIDDFITVCESVSGMELSAFFSQWLYFEGRPDYTYRFGSEPVAGGYDVSVSISQRQSTPPVYEMPIPLGIVTASDTTWVVADNRARHETFVYRTDAPAIDVLFDPERIVLRNVPVTTAAATTLAAFPNPFIGSARIAYDLSREEPVTLRVYDVAGRRVRTLIDGRRQRASQVVTWDGRNDDGVRLGSGVYYLELSTPSRTISDRVVLAR